MRSEFWNFIKSFNKRLLLYTMVVTTFVFLGSFPYFLFKLILFFVHLALNIMFMVTYSRHFIYPNIKLLLLSRKGLEIPVPEEIVKLQKEMGVRIKSLKVVDGLNTVCITLWKEVLVGRWILEALTRDEFKAVLAHEFAHQKGKHTIWRVLLTIPLFFIPIFSWSNLCFPILINRLFTQVIITILACASIFAFMVVMMTPIDWILELKADKTAAKYAGKENIKSALLKLTPKERLEQPTETHPSTMERIKHIEKLSN